MTFISGSAGVSYDAGTNTVSYTTGTLAPTGGTESFTVTVGVAADFAGSSVTNNATVSPPAGTTDSDNTNNTGTDTDAITRVADLSATKSDGVASVVAGTSTTYTITVTNGGPSSVTGATVSDVLPAGLTFISGSAGVSY